MDFSVMDVSGKIDCRCLYDLDHHLLLRKVLGSIDRSQLYLCEAPFDTSDVEANVVLSLSIVPPFDLQDILVVSLP